MDFYHSLNFLLTSFFLFLIGIFGLFATRKNMIVVLMSIEVMLLASTFNFAFFSVYLDDIVGQLFAMMILTVAAAESAIGLALIVIHYRHRAVISIDTISYLKG
jgi:NADH-quinone oxidoreductase subunit K